MYTYYNTTCPGWHDTRAIARAKLLQVQRGYIEPTRSDRSALYSTETAGSHDTEIITMEKQLQLSCDAPGEVVL